MCNKCGKLKCVENCFLDQKFKNSKTNGSTYKIIKKREERLAPTRYPLLSSFLRVFPVYSWYDIWSLYKVILWTIFVITNFFFWLVTAFWASNILVPWTGFTLIPYGWFLFFVLIVYCVIMLISPLVLKFTTDFIFALAEYLDPSYDELDIK